MKLRFIKLKPEGLREQPRIISVSWICLSLPLQSSPPDKHLLSTLYTSELREERRAEVRQFRKDAMAAEAAKAATPSRGAELLRT